MIELEKGKTGLGLSLAGNRDRSRMSVFVVGIDPNGAAGRDGHMVVGDELLEVRCLLVMDPNSHSWRDIRIWRKSVYNSIFLYPLRSMGKSFMATVTRMHPP